MSAANRARARDGTASVAPEPPATRYLRPPPSLRRYWRRAPAPALWAWELRRHKRRSFDGPDCGSKSPVPSAAITAGRVSRGLLIDPGTEPKPDVGMQTIIEAASLASHRVPWRTRQRHRLRLSKQSLGRRWNLKAGRGQFRTQRRFGRNRRGELVLCRIKSERAAYADQCSGCRRHDKGPRIEHDHGFGKTLNVDAIRSVA